MGKINFTYKRVLISAAFNIRLEDLQPSYRLRTECYGCGHVGFVDPVSLRQRHEPYERLVALESKMKCRKCKSRGKNTIGWQVVKVEF
jgi:hypothetical protein